MPRLEPPALDPGIVEGFLAQAAKPGLFSGRRTKARGEW